MNEIDFGEILSVPLESIPKGGLLINSIPEFDRPVIIYGGGQLCKKTILHLNSNSIRPLAVCDSKLQKIGTDIYGYKIMSFDDALKKFSDFIVLIASSFFYDDIKEYLLKFIPDDRINIVLDQNFTERIDSKVKFRNMLRSAHNQKLLNNIYSSFNDDYSRDTLVNVLKGKCLLNSNYFSKVQTDKQYFNNITLNADDFECFIDGGACDGDTIKQFINFKNNKFTKIYAFEPLNNFFEGLQNSKKMIFNDDKRIQLFNCGLYDSNRKIGFDANDIDNYASRIDESIKGVEDIDVVSIDQTVDEKVTFIKLDIEGSELKALHGAKQTILKYKPKLAICVYHENNDLLEIPEFIMSLGLDYRYYLRHHDDKEIETVFYAV